MTNQLALGVAIGAVLGYLLWGWPVTRSGFYVPPAPPNTQIPIVPIIYW